MIFTKKDILHNVFMTFECYGGGKYLQNYISVCFNFRTLAKHRLFVLTKTKTKTIKNKKKNKETFHIFRQNKMTYTD